MKSSELLAAAAGVAIGLALREWWLRAASKREAEAMRALSEAEALVTASLAAGGRDGDTTIECTRGDNRTFGVSQSDTALVLIDMQSDFLHRKGRLGQHYDAGRHATLAKTITQVERLLTAARAAGLTIAHSRSRACHTRARARARESNNSPPLRRQQQLTPLASSSSPPPHLTPRTQFTLCSLARGRTRSAPMLSLADRYGASIRRDLLEGPQAGAPEVEEVEDAAADGVTPQHFGRVDVGYELLPRLRALPGEIVVDKWTFGAFACTDLERQLRRRGVRKILLCGILTNVCVHATAVQACDRLFRVCLLEDATGAFKSEWHEKALDLISGPQIAPGHAGKAVGLYFGEVSTVANVEAALAAFPRAAAEGGGG